MKTTNINIRKATKKDIDDCIILCKMSRGKRRPKNNLWSQHIQKCIQNHGGIVAIDEDNIIGFAIRGQLRDKIHLQDIFIQKPYRRSGIGYTMIDTIIQIAKKAGYEEIISDCDIDNQTSINFHIKNGFTKTGRITGHRDGVDSYTFVKKL